MALIATTERQADVTALGESMDASVEFSGALMEMLSTIYKYILMAAIREGIQNACDAARRNGLTFSEGVMVLLPTADNPMVTIIDKGQGMTHQFMTKEYLSFGTSTKAGDDGAAGGLGVGRWAAYGYNRECYVTTCNEFEMVERTYFQFQGPNGKPKVQLASEVPGKTAGTKVFFPVKETDVDETLRAVTWLKEIMQLTMGDSFSVDSPARLPENLVPTHSGVVLDLGEVNDSLKGIKIYPMRGEQLQYGRGSLTKGSLVVLTNQGRGVGGLPFHVQSANGAESVFDSGMVIEIPMSYRIPFMPSREEIKYSDEVASLLRAIDLGAAEALLKRVGELYSERSLTSKVLLNQLLGDSSTHHCFSRQTRTDKSSMSGAIRAKTGNRTWHGSLTLPYLPELRDFEMTCKFDEVGTMRTVQPMAGFMAVFYKKDMLSSVEFKAQFGALTIVVNDLPSGGMSRFRAWSGTKPGRKLYLAHKSDSAKAFAVAQELSDLYGGEIEIVRTSSMPAFVRTVVGSKIVRTRVRGGGLTHYCTVQHKQVAGTDYLTEVEGVKAGSKPTKRVWIEKDGAKLGGFNQNVQMHTHDGLMGYSCNFEEVLVLAGLTRLYLLTPKQSAELKEAIDDLKSAGYWDMDDDELREEPDGELLYLERSALKTWTSLEEFCSEMHDHPLVADIREGRKMQKVTANAQFVSLVNALAKKPRMELTGSSFDRAIAPHLDLLSGVTKVHNHMLVSAVGHKVCQALAYVGANMTVMSDSPDERKALAAKLVDLRSAGTIDYTTIHQELKASFPLLGMITQHWDQANAVDDLVKALAAVYR